MGASFRLEGFGRDHGSKAYSQRSDRRGTLPCRDIVLLPINGTIRGERITGIEFGDKRPDGTMEGFVGLLVGDVPSADIPGPRAALETGKLLLVENAT